MSLPDIGHPHASHHGIALRHLEDATRQAADRVQDTTTAVQSMQEKPMHCSTQ